MAAAGSSGEVGMTDAAAIKDILVSTYKARVDGDVDATMVGFADDIVFEFNGRGTGLQALAAPVQGKAALLPVMRELISNYRFSDWRVITLLVDGDKALLHWRALITFAANGKAAEFDVVDVITIRDGKMATFHQSTDTAMIMAMTAA
jgi:ketosteroid isomerase-like protein